MAGSPIVIDWNAGPIFSNQFEEDAKKKQKGNPPASWLTDFLGLALAIPVSLAESTGLRVTLPGADEPDADGSRPGSKR